MDCPFVNSNYICEMERMGISYISNWNCVLNPNVKCTGFIYAIYCTVCVFGMSLLDYFYKIFASVRLD